MKLSVVLPAHNEADVLNRRRGFALDPEGGKYSPRAVVVNDNSTDRSGEVLTGLAAEIPDAFTFRLPQEPGFRKAVRAGLGRFTGECVVICMADGSDSPEDVVLYYRTMLLERVDCVFGSRFMPGAKVVGYPLLKLLLNRFANKLIQVLFGLRYNDVTNAFKLFRRPVIEGVQPLLSHHFNLTVELPLKAIRARLQLFDRADELESAKGGRVEAEDQGDGLPQLFIVLYCFIEKWLSKGDYERRHEAKGRGARAAAFGRRVEGRAQMGSEHENTA